MSKVKIVFEGHVDRDAIITALTIDSSYLIDVVAPDGSVSSIELNDLDSTNKEAFYKTLDNATYLFEADAFVWKIKTVDKTFNLDNSFVRDAVSTGPTLTSLTDGTPLKVTFETPGFLTNTAVEIDLWYNQDFNPTDIAALAAIGIDLSGNGLEFSIDNTIECKISFRKPVSASEIYVIDYDFEGQIITV